MSPPARTGPIAAGVLLGLAAATAFGLTIPVLAWAGAGGGAFATAALLYAGASLGALGLRPLVREAGVPLDRRALPALLVMALAGAAAAPVLLAWGIQRTGPATAGLLLNLEALWTVLLGRAVHREFLGRRVAAALALMTLGGGVLSLAGRGSPGWGLAGVAAVVCATAAWAVDNTASRRLAELRPLTVVGAKGTLGATLTTSLALAAGDAWPAGWRAGALLLAGATGYGAGLRLYLLAQRRIGAARTASVFAVAPFIGAGLGLAVEGTLPDGWTSLAAVLLAAGVALHASERHAHPHRHEAAEHEHAHRHDDGHHGHEHPGAVAGEHSHPHRHEPLAHAHEHGEDVHHGHVH